MAVIAVVGDHDERHETHRGIDRVLASLPRGLSGSWHATDELCNFGLAPPFEERLSAAGLVFSGHAPDAGVEIVELPGHPFYVGSMFQPQMSPRPDGREHPLLQAFFDAARPDR